MLSGDMPIVGGYRFGVTPKKEAPVAPITVHVHHVPITRPAAPPAPKPFAATGPYTPFLSATGKELRVGDYVRGSDRTTNEKVNCGFRGEIIEFIPPTPEGNNVRVRCSVTKKVYRVKNREIRHAK